MEKYRGKDIDSLCRTCLEVLEETKYDVLLLPQLAKKIIICTSLTVDANDIFPKNLCEKCFLKLDELYAFHSMCIASVQKVQEFVSASLLLCEDGNEEKAHSMDVDIKEDTRHHMEIPFEDYQMPKNEHYEEDDEWKSGNSKHDEDENFEVEECSENEDEDSEEEEEEVEVKKALRKKPNRKSVVEKCSENEEEGEEAKKAPQKKRDRKRTGERSENKVEKIYNCDQCPQRFFKEHRFIAHQRFHQGLKPFACPHCEKEFAKASGLGTHVRDIHTDKQTFTCEEPGCEKSYNRRQTLRWHYRTTHINTPSDAASKVVICEDCGKTFKNLHSLKKHMYKHNGKELPFECDECPKRYVTKHKLKEHQMRHAGIKNFICPYCGMRKTTRTELKTHINYHTKEKQYPCKFCDQIFNSTGNLSRHVRIVHEGVKTFPCRHCGRKFGKAETCKHHEMTHTGERPHECPECKKRFIQLVAMRVHLKRHEKNRAKRRETVVSGDMEADDSPAELDETLLLAGI